MLCCLGLGFMLSRLGIPALRRIKTGKFDIYIGDRFKTDGSEPSGGGAVLFGTFVIGLCAAWLTVTPERNELLAGACCGVYCGALTALGLYEDIIREKKLGLGMKGGYTLLARLLLSGVTVWLLGLFGIRSDKLLLPFRWGYLDLGAAYLPIAAALMTGIIYAFEAHDTQKGVPETGVDGLCASSGALAGIALSAVLSAGAEVSGRRLAAVISLCIGASCAAFLIWGLPPAKIYIGRSGTGLIGGAFGCCMVCSGLWAAVLLMTAAPLTDAATAALQRAVFWRKKKLLLKGASLHEHFTNTRMSGYTAIAVFALMTAAGTALAGVYVWYESRIII